MIHNANYRLRRAIDRIVQPGGRAVVLLYHRVVDEWSDPYALCVRPTDFEQQLQTVLQAGVPTPLSDVARMLREGTLPDRAISITFDDAYIDNLENAAPLLERYGVPATIFVTTGAGGRVREFWWDELERIFFQSPRLPERLELAIEDQEHVWQLDDAIVYGEREREHHRGWHLGDDRTPSTRHAVFRDVYFCIRPLTVAARTKVMDTLLTWAGLAADEVRHTRSVLRPEQVAQMSRGGLVQFGAHTVNHPDLSAQEPSAQYQEVYSSRRELEGWLGAPVEGFAYPYGLYNDAAVGAVREAGFDFACSGDWRLVNRRDDRHLLPRIEVPVDAPDGVERLLHRWRW